jgi:hypothetical protein
MVWQECCRNGAISTGASNQNFYIEAIVNRCLSSNPCNGSPQMNDDPYAFVCGGQPFVFNNSAIDPDLDSLSYSFAPALQGPGSSVTYIPPYSAQTPMPWTGPASGVFPAGISCNSITGDIMFTPPTGGGGQIIGVMAIEVRQWRTINGIPTLIGITRRDIQMVVLQCPVNTKPRILTRPSATGNQAKTSWSVCAGEQLCFDIVAKDTDFLPPSISDTTKLSWSQSLLRFGATFTPNYNPSQRRLLGPREDDFKFCWQTSDSMASNTPYYFTVRAKDSRCPIPGTVASAFNVSVLAKPDVIIQKISQACGKWLVRYNLPPNKPNQSFTLRSWQISREPYDYAFLNGAYAYTNTQQTPTISFTKGGKYLVLLNIATPGPPGESPCLRTYYDTIIVDNTQNPVSVLPDSARICFGESYVLDGGNNNNKKVSYLWNSGDTSRIIIRNDSNNYVLRMTDSLGCVTYDTLRLRVNPKINAFAGYDRSICSGETILLTATGGQQYEWKNLNTNVIISPKSFNSGLSVTPSISTVYEASIFQSYPNPSPGFKECVQRDSVKINVLTKPIVGPISGANTVRNNTNPFVYSIPAQPGVQYLWDAINGNISGRNDSNALSVLWLPFNSGNGKVKVMITNNAQCSDSASMNVVINTSQTELNLLRKVIIYPNPNKGLFTLQLFSESSGIAELHITDLFGKEIWNQTLLLYQGENYSDIETKLSAKGMYLLKISSGMEQKVLKLMVD